MQTTQRHRGAYGDVDSGEARKRRMLGREGFPKKIERERERINGRQSKKQARKKKSAGTLKQRPVVVKVGRLVSSLTSLITNPAWNQFS